MQIANTSHKWTYVFHERTRILVVDDDPILLEFASVYLSTPVADVQTASNGQAALELLLSNEFDVAVFDISMPGMDGFELVQQVRACEKLRHLPIVMLTGLEDIASIDRAYTVGATSFTTKPVNWRLLSYQLRYVIRASRMEAVAPGAPGRDGVALENEKPAARQDDLAASLKWIIDTANLIAAAGSQDFQAERLRELAAMAENVRRGFLAVEQEAGAGSPSTAAISSDTKLLKAQ
jgi:DNA-binding response OmpR family regulator